LSENVMLEKMTIEGETARIKYHLPRPPKD